MAKAETPPRRGGRPPARRVRKNLMVDPTLLAEVMELTGTTNQSDAVDKALRLSAAHASAMRGLRELVGAAPDFEYQDT